MKEQHEHITIIMAKTTFGQGDSSTEVWAECRNCNKRTEFRWIYGFPATEEIMREVQSDLEKLK